MGTGIHEVVSAVRSMSAGHINGLLAAVLLSFKTTSTLQGPEHMELVCVYGTSCVFRGGAKTRLAPK